MKRAPLEFDGLTVECDERVYDPAEDSLLLAQHAAGLSGRTVVDVGCGTGLAAMVAARSGARVIATDPNPVALRLARRNAARNGLIIETVRTWFWDGLDANAVDVLLINPPYLPTTPDERVTGPLNMAFDAGRDGRRFLEGMITRLVRSRSAWPPGFHVLLVVSSLQGVADVADRFRSSGLDIQRVDAVEIDEEEVVLLRMEPRRRTS